MSSIGWSAEYIVVWREPDEYEVSLRQELKKHGEDNPKQGDGYLQCRGHWVFYIDRNEFRKNWAGSSLHELDYCKEIIPRILDSLGVDLSGIPSKAMKMRLNRGAPSMKEKVLRMIKPDQWRPKC